MGRKWIRVRAFHGPRPKGHEVDHKNRNRADDRSANLHWVTRVQNRWNTGIRATNTTGHPNVFHDKKRGTHVIQIVRNGQYFYIGRVTDYSDAVAACKNALQRLIMENA